MKEEFVTSFENFLQSTPPEVWYKICSTDLATGISQKNKKNISKKLKNLTVDSYVNFAIEELQLVSELENEKIKKFEKLYRAALEEISENTDGGLFDRESVMKRISTFGSPSASPSEESGTWFENLLSKKAKTNDEDYTFFTEQFIPYASKMIQQKTWHPIPVAAFINKKIFEFNAHHLFTPYIAHIIYFELLSRSNYNFLHFTPFMKRIDPQTNLFISSLKDYAEASILVEEVINETEHFSTRQIEVYKLFKGKKKIAPRYIEMETDIPRPTINQILRKLEQLGKIKRLGKGRSTEYIKC